MRLLLDENTSSGRFRRALAKAGHDVETVAAALGIGADDGAVAAYAISAQRVLITQDQADFREQYRDRDEHPGVIVIYPGPRALDFVKLAAAVGHVAATYPDPTGLILSLNEFFW